MRASHETICTYLYMLPRCTFKWELVRHLRNRYCIRRPRKVRLSPRPIQDLISIDKRPPEVADPVPGHWEGDLLVGHANASALGTLVERTTRVSLLVPLQGKDAATLRRAFARELLTLPANSGARSRASHTSRSRAPATRRINLPIDELFGIHRKTQGEDYVFNFDANCVRNLTTFGPTTAVQ